MTLTALRATAWGRTQDTCLDVDVEERGVKVVALRVVTGVDLEGVLGVLLQTADGVRRRVDRSCSIGDPH